MMGVITRDLDVCMIQISLDDRLKFESYFQAARDICETCACRRKICFLSCEGKSAVCGNRVS